VRADAAAADDQQWQHLPYSTGFSEGQRSGYHKAEVLAEPASYLSTQHIDFCSSNFNHQISTFLHSSNFISTTTSTLCSASVFIVQDDARAPVNFYNTQPSDNENSSNIFEQQRDDAPCTAFGVDYAHPSTFGIFHCYRVSDIQSMKTEACEGIKASEFYVPDCQQFEQDANDGWAPTDPSVLKDESPKQCNVIATEDFIIEPGCSVAIPVAITNINTKRKSKNAAYTLQFVEDIKKVNLSAVPLVVSPTRMRQEGVVISNRLDRCVVISAGDRIAVLDKFMHIRDRDEWGVDDLDKFAFYVQHQRLPTDEETSVQIAQVQAAQNAKFEDIVKGASAAAAKRLRQLKSSKYFEHFNAADPRIVERITHVTETLNIGDVFNEEQAEKVRLICAAFADVYCLGKEDIPCADVDPMRIETKGDPIKMKARPTPLAAREFLKTEIDALVKAGVLKPVKDAKWAFPFVIVKKRGGGYRAAIDYRLINNITQIPVYPIPRIEDLVLSVAGMKLLAAIDMASAYYQLPLHPDDQEKSTVISEFGLHSFTRVPFGLAGAVSHFQSRLEEMLSGARTGLEPGKQLLSNYLDDVVIGGTSFENFEKALIEFFKTFRAKGCKISTKKSIFGVKEINYLGFKVDAHTWQPDPDRIKALMERPPPRTLKEIRGLTSSLSFYNRFLPYVAQQLAPFTEQLKEIQKRAGRVRAGSVKVNISEESKIAWMKIKQLLRERVVLWHLNPKNPFFVFVDTSDVASGGIIFQKLNGELRAIAFFSKILQKPERAYSASEREMLGVVNILKKYKGLMMGGATIHVYVDHMAIVAIMKSRAETSGRLSRWRVQFHEFGNITWHHLPGVHHGGADWLSRPADDVVKKYDELVAEAARTEDSEVDLMSNPFDAPFCLAATDSSTSPEDKNSKKQRYKEMKKLNQLQEDIVSGMRHATPTRQQIIDITMDKIRAAQKTDDLCKLIRAQLEAGDEEDEERAVKKGALHRFARRCVLTTDGVVLCPDMLASLHLVPVVPESLRQEIMQTAHVWDLGHMAGDRLFTLIAERGIWPGMQGDIERFVKNCDTCTHFAPGMRFRAPPGTFSASYPWEQITLDVVQLEKRDSNYPVALCALDTFSRFAVIMPLKNETAEEQIRAIKNYILPLGTPAVFVLDRHPVYTSKKFTDFVKTIGAKLSLSPGYSSTHVALVNRLHRTIREILAKCSSDDADWVDSVWIATRAYNGTIHPVTGFSPAFILNGRSLNYQVDKILPNPYNEKTLPIDKRLEIVQKARDIVKERFKTERMKQLADFEKKALSQKRRPVINERVMRVLDVHRRKGGKQAAVRAFGPYIVTKIEKDCVHAVIISELTPDGDEGTRVRIDELIPIGDRQCTPVYSTLDFVTKKDETPACVGLQEQP
jgi:hypothetical protein